MHCSKSDITKNSRWREKSAGNDRVKVEYTVGDEIIFRDTDSGSYGAKGRMDKRVFSKSSSVSMAIRRTSKNFPNGKKKTPIETKCK